MTNHSQAFLVSCPSPFKYPPVPLFSLIVPLLKVAFSLYIYVGSLYILGRVPVGGGPGPALQAVLCP
jgi:hypothetical protein